MKGMPSEEHIRREAELEGEPYEKERAEYEHGAKMRGRKKHKHGGATEGHKGHRRLDRPGRKDGGKWIQGAIKHPGALHAQLGVPQGEKIPEAKLNKAAHSDNPTLRRRANLAKTLKGFHH